MRRGKDMEEEVFQMYLNEMIGIKSCNQEENKQLLGQFRAGNQGVKDRLIEGNLKIALEMVQEFLNRGIPAGDLVQEANMALVMAVGEYEEGNFEDYLRNQIRESLLAVVDEQSKEQNVAQELVNRVNRLKDISQEMAEELGREAKVEELAQRMGMTNDEVKEVMKITMEAVNWGNI